MGAVDEVMKLLKQDIDQLDTDDETGAVILDERRIEAPDLETLLDRLPDVIGHEGVGEENINPQGTNERGQLVLGVYKPMHSPGIVILYGDNIRIVFRSVLRKFSRRPYGMFISRPDIERIGLFITKSVFYHEVFHFHCDVYQKLFGSTFHSNTEEALATAYERLKLEEERRSANSQFGRMNGVIFNAMMDICYRINSPGYCDWPLYADEPRFKAGLVDYINPENYLQLRSSGVGIEDMLFEMTGRVGGYVDKVK